MLNAEHKKTNTFQTVLEEVHQGHSIRRNLYTQLEHALDSETTGRYRVVAFFTSFTFPVLLSDGDADILEEVLQNSDMKDRQLMLLLNSPGGDALAAERIINICRNYGTDDDFSVIVPKMAKSAGTMVCLGAKNIGMSRTSELGPIDPQILLKDETGNPVKYQAAHEVIESYEELIKQANNTKGRIEPFLQQLNRFDARDIRSIKSAQALSESIAISSLKRGCFKHLSVPQIKQKIKPFLDPQHTKVHGRPIYHDTAKNCGLPVSLFDSESEIWQIVWKLYVRMSYYVSNHAPKLIESAENSYHSKISLMDT